MQLPLSVDVIDSVGILNCAVRLLMAQLNTHNYNFQIFAVN